MLLGVKRGIFAVVREKIKRKFLKLSRLIEFKASKLKNSTALKMADSPIIREYFLSPRNAELERLVFKEIAGYSNPLEKMLKYLP